MFRKTFAELKIVYRNPKVNRTGFLLKNFKNIWKKLNSLVYNKKILSRQKGNKDYTLREKQMMVSLINDYSLFGSSDDEMIQMISKKIGKENNDDKIMVDSRNAKSAIFPPIDSTDSYNENYSKENGSIKDYDPNRVF